jgi:L-ascorbate metabolism protein UlaG (beta-lactamase superfamily)
MTLSPDRHYGGVDLKIPTAVRRSALLLPAAAIVRAAWDIPTAIGGRATGARLERMRRSPQFRDGSFHNRVAAGTVPAGSAPEIGRELLRNRAQRRPSRAIPVVTPSAGDLADPPRDGLRLTWLGHATALVELEGRRVLFDPVWSSRCSPSALIGPRRLHRVPLPLDALPPLDAVVISHDHYDHLDMATIRRLATLQAMPFVVPLGVGAHLERWGVRPSRITELDWDETTSLAGLELTATAARHFSGRLRQDNSTLWASWVVAGPNRRVYYTGDSGYFEDYRHIGETYGPFDATLVQVGAYSPYWPDIHMTPEEGVATHLAVGGGLLVPVHWCTFNLALHPWSEPMERLTAEAAAHDVRVAIPKPGQLLDVDRVPAAPDTWWRAIA